KERIPVEQCPEMLEGDGGRYPARREAHDLRGRLYRRHCHTDNRDDPDQGQRIAGGIFEDSANIHAAHHESSDLRPIIRNSARLIPRTIAKRMKPTAAACPKSNDSKAVRYMNSASTSEDVPGPPLVMIST